MTGYLTRVALRWVDLDAQGHVNNAVVLDYLQEARVRFLQSGDNAHLLGSSTIVVAHQVEFLRPVLFSVDPVEIELVVGKVGAASLHLGYEVLQAGAVVARARTQLAKVRAGRPQPFTPAERSWFAERQAEVAPLRDLGRWAVGPSAHEYLFQVRWSDLDPYRHVNNVRLFDYVAEARNRLDPGGGRTRMELAAEAETTWMVARQDVNYRAEILHRAEPYRIRTGYAAVGRTSMTLAAQVEDPLDDRLLARSVTVLVHGDAAGRPVPVPPDAQLGLELWPAVPRP